MPNPHEVTVKSERCAKNTTFKRIWWRYAVGAMVAVRYYVIPIWNTKLHVEKPSNLFLEGTGKGENNFY